MLRAIKDWFKDWFTDLKLKRQQNTFVQGDFTTGKFTPVSKTDGGKLYRLIAKDHCPDCHAKGFWSGPSGGISQNIYCTNSECRSAFNVTEMIGTADRIGKAPDRIYADDKAVS